MGETTRTRTCGRDDYYMWVSLTCGEMSHGRIEFGRNDRKPLIHTPQVGK